MTATTVHSKVFLAARWQDLILLNYCVPDALLEPLLPKGITLDHYEGSAFVSLVAFDFLETRVLGVKWPGFVNFAEINLRFYVRQGDRRGVSFIREIVPSKTVALMARLLYNEPYVAAPISSLTTRGPDTLEKDFRLTWHSQEQRIAVTANSTPHLPSTHSTEHFFKEHEWGFGRARDGKTIVYRVEHPVWEVYPVLNHTLAFDFGAVYGSEWTFLNGQVPHSACLAAGSDIKVSPKQA